jgi:uncharacterized membrane-anchored protein
MFGDYLTLKYYIMRVINTNVLTENNKLKEEYREEMMINAKKYQDLFNQYIPKERDRFFKTKSEKMTYTTPLLIDEMELQLIIEKHNTNGVAVHLNYLPFVRKEILEKLRTNNSDFRNLLKLAFYIKTKYKTVVDNDAFQ